MTVKIISEDQSFKPVKIEITFETKEQLQTFVDLYGASPSFIVEALSEECSRITEQGYESLLDLETWSKLSELADWC